MGVPPSGACSKHLASISIRMEAGSTQTVRTSLAKNKSLPDTEDERRKLRNLDASDSSTDGNTSKEGFMIAIDTSKTSIVDSLVSIAAEEASFVPGRWERSFRRLGKEGESSMGL